MEQTPKNDLTGLFGRHPNMYETDYLAEVIAAALIEQGYDPEQVVIVREGIARRGVSTEIEKVYEQYSPDDLMDYIYIKANKEGVYDMLPQGLFHEPTYKRTYKDIATDVEKALDEIKIHRTQEFFARKFFHLFELMADRTITKAYLFERKYDKKLSYSEFTELFARYWPLLRKLTLKQGVYFMHIIPIIHRIRSDYKNIQQALSCILEVPVEITEIKLPAKQADSFFESRLGDDRIGVSVVLGHQFDDGEYDLKITVGPISAKTMRNYLKTAKGYQILESLCEMFLPVNTFYITDFIIDPEDSELILSDDENETFLGVNSFI